MKQRIVAVNSTRIRYGATTTAAEWVKLERVPKAAARYCRVTELADYFDPCGSLWHKIGKEPLAKKESTRPPDCCLSAVLLAAFFDTSR